MSRFRESELRLCACRASLVFYYSIGKFCAGEIIKSQTLNVSMIAGQGRSHLSTSFGFVKQSLQLMTDRPLPSGENSERQNISKRAAICDSAFPSELSFIIGIVEGANCQHL